MRVNHLIGTLATVAALGSGFAYGAVGTATAAPSDCSYTGASECAWSSSKAENVERESNVPLHCWGMLDSARRVTVYYELSGDTNKPASRTKGARCSDDGAFTPSERAQMRARAAS